MRYIQFIFSPTGGTKKVADAITTHLSSSVDTIDLSNPETDFSQYSFQDDDVVLIAMPSFGGRVPSIAVQRLNEAKGNNAKCIIVCVYGNRAYEDSLVEMEDAAVKSGFQVIAAISAVAEHSIMHQYATNRPDESDVSQLKDFALKIKDKVEKHDTTKPDIPGNRPYKKAGSAGLVPKADSSCIKCGLCARQCPVQAINMDQLKSADSKKCISCMRCVSNCPNHARNVNKAMVAIASVAIKKACSEKKSNELFI